MLEKGVEAFLKATYKMRESVVTKSAKETASFGYLLGKTLQPGYIVGLIGGIGAGKTCLAGGIAGAFGMDKRDFMSPTFNIVREHRQENAVIYHFDFYRLESADELEKAGYREYITDPAAITLIEWPDRIEETMTDCGIAVLIKRIRGGRRKILVYVKKCKLSRRQNRQKGNKK